MKWLDWKHSAYLAGVLGLVVTGSLGAVEVARAPSGAEFVTGGISKDEADRLRAEAPRYPLEVEFSANRNDWPRNPFAADVNVRIVDRSGQTVLETSNSGPILLTDLPPGRYTIYATFNGVEKTRQVDVGRGHQKVDMVW